jgi:hypothetical protein
MGWDQCLRRARWKIRGNGYCTQHAKTREGPREEFSPNTSKNG